jgi:hypothetical protein
VTKFARGLHLLKNRKKEIKNEKMTSEFAREQLRMTKFARGKIGTII